MSQSITILDKKFNDLEKFKIKKYQNKNSVSLGVVHKWSAQKCIFNPPTPPPLCHKILLQKFSLCMKSSHRLRLPPKLYAICERPLINNFYFKKFKLNL